NLSAGEAVTVDGRHVHQFNVDEAPSFNVSHTVHELRFGPTLRPPKVAARPRGPLDGLVRIVDEEAGTGLFQYFLQLVPTIYLNDADSRSGGNG
ncbi:unnamed protein product, partial [Phaeothamnion confervicola]